MDLGCMVALLLPLISPSSSYRLGYIAWIQRAGSTYDTDDDYDYDDYGDNDADGDSIHYAGGTILCDDDR